MIQRLLISIFLVTGICGQLSGQVNKDSLWSVINNGEVDTSVANACLNLCSAYYPSHLDTVELLCRSALDVLGPSSSIDEIFEDDKASIKLRGEALNNLALVQMNRDRSEEAMNNYALGLAIARRNQDSSATASILGNMAYIWRKNGNIQRALGMYMEAMTINEALGENSLSTLSKNLTSLGILHSNMRDEEKALEYYERSLEIREGLDHKRAIANSLNNMGSVYFKLKNYETALEYCLRSLAIQQEIGDVRGKSYSLSNIGKFYHMLGEVDSALVYHQRALDLKKESGNKKGMATTLLNIGLIRYEQNDIEAAKDLTEESLKIAQAIGYVEEISASAGLLKDILALQENNDGALEMYELHIKMRDSLANKENQRQIIRSEFKYDYEKESLTDSLEYAKKEAVITERSDKQKLGLVAAAGGLLLVLAFVIYSGKRKSDELLLNILPSETARELKKKGHADAKLIDDVTVLFTDFKGFTAMSEQLGPKELVKDLNDCFSEFDRIMEKHGIEKIKTIGDAYMAACGLPSTDPDHASKVIQAAFEMRDYVEARKQRKMDKGQPYFEVRIGVQTGRVVAGIVGIKKFQYEIWGDTVNTASRLESSGVAGKVNISDFTYQLVKDHYTCEYRGEVVAKGKGKIKMYFVEVS